VKKLISDTFLKKRGRYGRRYKAKISSSYRKITGKDRNDWDMGVIRNSGNLFMN
jgi:hypothetical protein